MQCLVSKDVQPRTERDHGKRYVAYTPHRKPPVCGKDPGSCPCFRLPPFFDQTPEKKSVVKNPYCSMLDIIP